MTKIVSNPEDQKKIKGALQEISDSLTRIESERALIKDIKEELHEAFKDTISKKMISKMASTYHKRNFESQINELEEFEVLYTNITGEKSE